MSASGARRDTRAERTCSTNVRELSSEGGITIRYTYVTAPYFVLRLEIEKVEPLIWRIVRVPGDLRLKELHGVLQKLLGWDDRHHHAFDVRGSGEELTVEEALSARRSGFTYMYDVECGWRVRITRAHGVWRSVSKAPITCLDGYLAGPRDDSGGPVAYTAILAATLGRGPRLSPEALERLGPNFDPEAFDRPAINRELALLHRDEGPPSPLGTSVPARDLRPR